MRIMVVKYLPARCRIDIILHIANRMSGDSRPTPVLCDSACAGPLSLWGLAVELHSFAQCVVPLAPKRFGRALSAGKGVLVCARFSAPANALWKICEPGYSCVIGKKAVLLGGARIRIV